MSKTNERATEIALEDLASVAIDGPPDEVDRPRPVVLTIAEEPKHHKCYEKRLWLGVGVGITMVLIISGIAIGIRFGHV